MRGTRARSWGQGARWGGLGPDERGMSHIRGAQPQSSCQSMFFNLVTCPGNCEQCMIVLRLLYIIGKYTQNGSATNNICSTLIMSNSINNLNVGHILFNWKACWLLREKQKYQVPKIGSLMVYLFQLMKPTIDRELEKDTHQKCFSIKLF